MIHFTALFHFLSSGEKTTWQLLFYLQITMEEGFDPVYIFNRFYRQFPLRPWNNFFDTTRLGFPNGSSKVLERLVL